MNYAKRIERMLEAVGRALAEDFGAVVEPSAELDTLQPLEAAVALLLAELAETKRRNHEQILEIRAKNREITDRQAQRLRELSTPIIAVWDGLLALPLVGLIDAERGQALIEAVLSRVMKDRARYVIIDVTGTRDLDAKTAQYLLRTARAVRLLGANCCLTGVSPELARTLVQLSIDLNELRTSSRLGEALKLAFSEMNIAVTAKPSMEWHHE